MNTKRVIFWGSFIVVLGLIVWGLIAAMNKPAPTVSFDEPAPVTSADHVKGSALSSVTVIEYSDFQCPACRAYQPLIKLIAEGTTTPIRLVYRHFPLPQHTYATLAAQASEAAALQGKFWEMHDLLFTEQLEWGGLKTVQEVRNQFVAYAESLRLDKSKFETDLDSDAVKQVVDKNVSEARTLGLNATPTFFVNGKYIENPQGYEPFKAIIEAAAKGTNNN